jgi:GH18 family chitinase
VKYYSIILIFLLANLFSCKKPGTPYNEQSDIIIAGYLPYYGMLKVDLGITRRLDHLYYFSTTPDAEGRFFMEASKTSDIDDINNYLSRFDTKLFLVVGGWYESENIHLMASDPLLRADYIEQLVDYCLLNDIEGIDLDWESYPVPVDEDDFRSLVKELSAALKNEGLLFSIAMAASQSGISGELEPYYDFVNVMSYGILDTYGNHVPIIMFRNYTLDYVYAGIPRSKIIMGVPYYAKRPYAEGDNSSRYMVYRDIVALSPPTHDQNSYGKYSYNGRTMLENKTRYLIDEGIGGIMAWELSQDVEIGSPYSLTSAILNAAGR